MGVVGWGCGERCGLEKETRFFLQPHMDRRSVETRDCRSSCRRYSKSIVHKILYVKILMSRSTSSNLGLHGCILSFNGRHIRPSSLVSTEYPINDVFSPVVKLPGPL